MQHMPETQNPEMSISLIWSWSIGLLYDRNLKHVSRQIMANQIGPDDSNVSDWSWIV